MKAIVKSENGVQLKETPLPTLKADDVLIKVKAAGLCRTDIYVADDIIESRTPLILGHEFSGIVEATGEAVQSIKPGDHVTATPLLPCGHCTECARARPDICQNTTMLGVSCDGAFAEYISVPAQTVFRLPTSLPFLQGAYSEPVAASLAVMKSGIQADQKGLIYGENRISQLTLAILDAYGFKNVEMVKPFDADQVSLRRNTYDFIIETLVTSQTMCDMQDMVRPGGKIILKSRKHQPVAININRAVLKETTFSSVNYGDFADGIALMADRKLEVDGLFGRSYGFDDYREMFEAGRLGESKKLFLVMD